MNKKDKNRTKRTSQTGSSNYKGYCSKNVANSYDNVTNDIKDVASSLGGTFDNGTKSYNGNRFRFSSKESRDNFNQELDKMRQEKNKKKETNENRIVSIFEECLLEELRKKITK